MNLKKVLCGLTLIAPGLLVSACQTDDLKFTRTGSAIYTIPAKSGHKTGLLSNYMVNPDCSSGKTPDFKVVTAPTNGTIDLWRGSVSPSFRQGHPQQKCNAHKVAAVGAFTLPDQDLQVPTTWSFRVKHPAVMFTVTSLFTSASRNSVLQESGGFVRNLGVSLS